MPTHIDQLVLSSQPASGEIIQLAGALALLPIAFIVSIAVEGFSGQGAFRVKSRARLARERHREMTHEVAKIRKDKPLAKAVGLTPNDPSDAAAELLVNLDRLDALTPTDHDVDVACRVVRRRDRAAREKVWLYAEAVGVCYKYTWRGRVYRQVVAFRDDRRRKKAQAAAEKKTAANREQAAQILDRPPRDRGRELADARVVKRPRFDAAPV